MVAGTIPPTIPTDSSGFWGEGLGFRVGGVSFSKTTRPRVGGFRGFTRLMRFRVLDSS